MWSYILRRLLFGIPTLLGVTIIVFSLLHLSPGDPVSAMVPADAPQELVLMIRQQMGLDQPWPVQYWRWLRRVVFCAGSRSGNDGVYLRRGAGHDSGLFSGPLVG
jgi:peptide/nickel transport system permease protein